MTGRGGRRVLLGAGVDDWGGVSPLTPDHVNRVAAMAVRHGFKLADYRRACVLGSDRNTLSHAIAR